MTLHTEYTTDEVGSKWVDDTGLYANEAGGCFMCGTMTHRVDVSFCTFFCNSESCNQAIEDDLKKLPESDLSDFG